MQNSLLKQSGVETGFFYGARHLREDDTLFALDISGGEYSDFRDMLNSGSPFMEQQQDEMA